MDKLLNTPKPLKP